MKLYKWLTIIAFAIVFSLVIYIVFNYIYTDEPELQLVTVVFRHGDRMPHTSAGEGYVNNPNAENNYFPIGQGGLTNDGKLREYNLGQFLREKYNNFLDSTFTPEVLEARSTNYERTILSLQLVLAGLYPPNNDQVWNPSLNWQPIPTYYEPETKDILLSTILCSRFQEQRAKIMQIPEVKEKFESFADLLKNLTTLVGRPITTTFDVAKIYFTILTEYESNFTIPNWASRYLYNQHVINAIKFDYEIAVYNNIMKKLTAGPLIRKMSEDMISVRNGSFTNGRKIFLYSGHESNLVTLLSSFGVYHFHVPKFSSAVIVEFYRLKEEYYVQVVYYLGIPPEIEIKEIPGCSKLCPLHKFLELMKPVTPNEDEVNSQCDL
ncbi:venom acid phosphatase Acph-1-like [Belonocnema kinseyi]|uniref:venom acid phosphatase Acph-1-like n=1 Tax=Belonocnema kinseyi TaxID=2817044 RepID=UPI00143D8488|nr:venom acid phosphatase Acph-1-like [Belonocnema kinseyi]